MVNSLESNDEASEIIEQDKASDAEIDENSLIVSIDDINILIDDIDERTVEYCIEGETFIIESHGIIPKIIDYGRSNFYKGDIQNDHVWFDVIMTLGVIYPYLQNGDLKQKIYDISNKNDMYLPSLKDYYIYIRDNL